MNTLFSVINCLRSKILNLLFGEKEQFLFRYYDGSVVDSEVIEQEINNGWDFDAEYYKFDHSVGFSEIADETKETLSDN